jgi:thioesterase domain-containing protein
MTINEIKVKRWIASLDAAELATNVARKKFEAVPWWRLFKKKRLLDEWGRVLEQWKTVINNYPILEIEDDEF